MKLEVGMYARTKNIKGRKSEFIKVIKIELGSCGKDVYYQTARETNLIRERNIHKASYNIIDLIEVGDYVNHKQIIFKYNENEWTRIVTTDLFQYANEDIKSVVTKEQFKSCGFTVER